MFIIQFNLVIKLNSIRSDDVKLVEQSQIKIIRTVSILSQFLLLVGREKDFLSTMLVDLLIHVEENNLLRLTLYRFVMLIMKNKLYQRSKALNFQIWLRGSSLLFIELICLTKMYYCLLVVKKQQFFVVNNKTFFGSAMLKCFKSTPSSHISALFSYFCRSW